MITAKLHHAAALFLNLFHSIYFKRNHYLILEIQFHESVVSELADFIFYLIYTSNSKQKYVYG